MIEIEMQKILQGAKGEMCLDVRCAITEGDFVVLMGPSGAGKTTLLRVLAGLDNAEGKIVVSGKSWNVLPPQEREIGFVFQDYALFENMTVEENLFFVSDDRVLAKELLEMTELSTLSKRNVKGLSGGQKQRVALCRALMNKPKLLLMDEPLSALDEEMREKLQNEIARVHKAFNCTTIMVSHDANAAYALADRVMVMKQGKILKDGNKDTVFKKVQKTLYTLGI